MPEFSSFLDEYEVELLPAFPTLQAIFDFDPDPTKESFTARDNKSAGRDLVASAYAQIKAEGASELQQERSEAAACNAVDVGGDDVHLLLRDLENPKTTLVDFRSMRRKVAWLCHPDREAADGRSYPKDLLKHVNERIDAAIKQSLART